MVFYKMNCKAEPCEELETVRGREAVRRGSDRGETLERLTEELNAGRGELCVPIADGGEPSAVVIGDSRESAVRIFTEYLSAAGFENVCVPTLKELTFSEAYRAIKRSRYSSGDLLDAFESKCVDMSDCDLNRRHGAVTEKMLDGEALKDDLLRRYDALFAAGDLTAELERIFTPLPERAPYGHPVHYVVESDGAAARSECTDILLEALYSAGRLKSRRVTCLNIENVQRHNFENVLKSEYKLCEGSSIVIDLSGVPVSDGDDFADETFCFISSKAGGVMKEYRSRVLTVFRLPPDAQKAKALLYEKLSGVAVMEIAERPAECADARKRLAAMAQKVGIAPDAGLLSGVKDGEKYTAAEIGSIFDSWYDNKLRTVIYPQYSGLGAAPGREPPRDEGGAYEKLSAMVGLTEAKAVIRKALDYYKVSALARTKAIKRERPAMHMVFTGDPGTAKTTAARLFAQILKENDILPVGQMVEVGRADLVARYVGWTAKNIKEKFDRAKGGVLFIDEAYSLVDDRAGSFGDEAINTIVAQMENLRDDVIVIFAGYADRMEEFLDRNPGLRSRIAFHVHFDNYTAGELCEIARSVAEEKGVTMTDGAADRFREVFDAARREPNFGNGRYVRNAVERAMMNMSSRIAAMDPSGLTDAILTIIEAGDVEPVSGPASPRGGIGFSA